MDARRAAFALFAAALFGVVPVGLSGQVDADRYRGMCVAGDADACAVLGLMFERGAGVEQDLGLAATFYGRACDQEVQLGCTNLGVLLQNGAGVPRDLPRATELFRAACERDEPLACDLARAAERAANATFFKAGRVEDAANGRAIDGAIVRVDRLGLRAVSDRFGRVELGRLRPGNYPVHVERFGYEPLDGVVDVPGNAEFMIIMTRADLEDPRAPGRIVGRVSDQDVNGALSDVLVTVRNSTTGTLSNAQGTFVLRGVEPGLLEVQFERIGYGTRTATVIVQPGATVEVSAAMSTRPIELDAIDVTVASGYDRQGFDRRAGAGWGTHFTPQELERIQAPTMYDLIRGRVAGVTLAEDYAGVTRVISKRAFTLQGDPLVIEARAQAGAAELAGGTPGACALEVFLDGVAVGEDIDIIHPEQIEALEVYQGIGTPIEYMRNGCGSVLIWTRLGN